MVFFVWLFFRIRLFRCRVIFMLNNVKARIFVPGFRGENRVYYLELLFQCAFYEVFVYFCNLS